MTAPGRRASSCVAARPARRGAAAGLVACGAMLLGGVSLPACGAAAGSPAQQVSGWARSTGFTATLSRLRGDLAHTGDAGVTGDAGALRTACDVLVTDTLGANQQLPTPDSALTALLSGAYANAGAAGHDCFHGAGDAALLVRSARARTAALAGLVRAEARYDELTSTLPRAGR